MNSCLGLRYERVDSEYLDCISDNLAVLLDYYRIADIRSPFASEWHFGFDGLTGMPVLERRTLSAKILEQTRLELTYSRLPENHLKEIADLLSQGEPVLLLGDAYHMPWLPYHGQEHQEHSFLIDGISEDGKEVHIVDAYYNKTEWGLAQPVDVTVPSECLDRAIWGLENRNQGTRISLSSHPAQERREWNSLNELHDNANAVSEQAEGELLAFASHYNKLCEQEEHADKFVLACWFAYRSRALHRLWLQDVENASPELLPPNYSHQFEEEVVSAWRKVNEFAYVMLRRVRQGKRAPLTSLEILVQQVAPAEKRLAEILRDHIASHHLHRQEV